MKRIGIVSDDYKLEKFKKELTNSGFTNFEIRQFAKGISNIFVTVSDSDILAIADLCSRVEHYFQALKARN